MLLIHLQIDGAYTRTYMSSIRKTTIYYYFLCPSGEKILNLK